MSRGWQEMPLPEGMPPEVITWRWFARAYGWTPNQVSELPIEAQTWLPIVEEAAHEAQERLQQQDLRASQPRR